MFAVNSVNAVNTAIIAVPVRIFLERTPKFYFVAFAFFMGFAPPWPAGV